MNVVFCKLSFRQFTATKLDTFSQNILENLYPNVATFASPPVDEAAMTSLYGKFVTAHVAYELYGITKKTTYVNSKKEVVDALNSLAVYVDSVSMGDVSKIALSGFEPSRETAEPTQPLEKIENFSAKRSENSGEIIITIAPIAHHGAINYGCVCIEGKGVEDLTIINGQIKTASNGTVFLYDINKSRRKVFTGLKPGMTYSFYVYATNSVSVSPISDIRLVMAA